MKQYHFIVLSLIFAGSFVFISACNTTGAISSSKELGRNVNTSQIVTVLQAED